MSQPQDDTPLEITVCPLLVPRAARATVTSFLEQANHTVSVGAFHLDPARGEVRFVTTFRAGADLHRRVAGCYFPAVARVACGVSVERALRQARSELEVA